MNKKNPTYDLASDILRVLNEKGPMDVKEMLIHVSGPKPIVTACVFLLEGEGKIRSIDDHEVKAYRKWEACHVERKRLTEQALRGD